MKPFSGIWQWLHSIFLVWRREFKLVFSDAGVLLFFFALPTLYPLVYTIIYNPELVRDIPVVIVDNARTAESRDLVRMVDASEAIKVYDYAPDLQAARRIMNEHECFGILEIPSDYSRKIGNGEQATVPFYSEMSLLIRYRSFVSALTDIQLAAGSQIQTRKIEEGGLLTESFGISKINSQATMLGDVSQGFASFIIPGILILILQQSMILGVTMLGGGAAERRRANGGTDPLAIPASPLATIIGKTMCYLVLYVPMLLYILHFVPEIFALPHVGNIWHYLVFLLPMMIGSALLGMSIVPLITERESSMVVFVFTSVVFLFLSGLTWPRYAMNKLWTLVGDCIPAMWGLEGFTRMNANGSTLAEQSHAYVMMWVLCGVYLVTAYIITRVLQNNCRPLHKAGNHTKL